MEQFLLAFETNLKPAVGQQVTVTAANASAASARIALLLARADAGDCDVIAKRRGRGYRYLGHDAFKQDRAGEPTMSRAKLLAGAGAGAVTFTCVPPGSGERLGIDRDQDGILDGDE